MLAQAAMNLAIQTSGYFDVRLEYDLDPDLLDLPGWSLLRVESSAPWILWGDLMVGGNLLGLTNTDVHRVFLVTDRLAEHPNPDVWFTHVAMHEFLHAAGLDHVQAGNVMPAMSPPGVAPQTCMNDADALQFCHVMRCEWQSLNYCGKPGIRQAIGLSGPRAID